MQPRSDEIFALGDESRIAPHLGLDYAGGKTQIKPQKPTSFAPTRRYVLGGVAAMTMMPLTARGDDDVAHVTAPRRLGDDKAPIKVVELFSMTCPHCASFHNKTFPDVKARLIDTGMVQFEMQPFPLDQIALRGHALARALPVKQYFPMVSLLLKDISRWAAVDDPFSALSRLARQAGMSAEKFEALMRNRQILEAIVEMRQAAYKTWDVKSTPSFIVNGKTVLSGAMSYEDFAAKINATDT